MATLKVLALIVAGGSSRRMGFDKLSAPLSGQPVLWRSVDAFDSHPLVDAVVVVAHPERVDAVAAMLRGAKKLAMVVPGGPERYFSVWAGLTAIKVEDSDIVAVHDGARPLIGAQAISSCCEAAARHGAATCARPVTETLKRQGNDGFLAEAVDREGLWIMETPQASKYGILKEAYRKLINDGVTATDENSVLQRAGFPVKIVETGSPNIKITYPSDLSLAEAWLKASRHDKVSDAY